MENLFDLEYMRGQLQDGEREAREQLAREIDFEWWQGVQEEE